MWAEGALACGYIDTDAAIELLNADEEDAE